MNQRPLRLLVLLQHAGHLRKFEAAILALTARGHRVHVSYVANAKKSAAATTARLLDAGGDITIDALLNDRTVIWPLGMPVRVCRDILCDLRHLSPRYETYRTIRGDAARRWPTFMVAWLDRLHRAGSMVPDAIARYLTLCEASAPVRRAVLRFLKDERPDVVLVSPLVAGEFLGDYVRAAAALGIPTALGVASWDNLTTKGGLHACPDGLIVWNETQRLEAHQEFGYPGDRVAVVGAHLFDHWFSQRPGDRAAYCRSIGLDPAQPYLLYLCSSRRIARREAQFVDQWIRAIRSSTNPRLRQMGVVVRPHFQNAGIWHNWTPPADNIVVFPAQGAEPVTDQSRADYFDTLHHSAAVVGINTTALIEAAIAGRAVLTVVTEDTRQHGMPHFRHLVEQGLVRVAGTLDEHLDHLAESLAHANMVDARARDFVQRFVRPYGLDTPGAPLFASAVEALARTTPGALIPPRAPRMTLWSRRLALVLLAPLGWASWLTRVLHRLRQLMGIEPRR